MEEVKTKIENNYWMYEPNYIKNQNEIFLSLLENLENKCKIYMIQMYDKKFESRRKSCIFVSKREIKNNAIYDKIIKSEYKNTPSYFFEEAPHEIIFIKNRLEKEFKVKLDYVLCHIYRGIAEKTLPNGEKIKEIGTDNIGWHNDREALNSDIFSVTFGATRRFQFRNLKDKSGYTDELILHSGDLVHMFGPRLNQKSCQKVYKHQLPKMNILDLKKHIKDNNFELPKGRCTFKNLSKIIEENNIPPTRINLTFRQF